MIKKRLMILSSILLVLLCIIGFSKFQDHAYLSTLKHYPATNEDFKKIKVKKIKKSLSPFKFGDLYNENIEKVKFNYQNDEISLINFLKLTETESFVFIKEDSILYEYYADGYSRKSPMMIWSVTKIFISTLTGIAVHEGELKSTNEKVIKYIPELKGKIHESITIEHLLNMTSGINYSTEKYNFTPYLEVHYGKNLMKYVNESKSVIPPGEKFRYSQIDVILLTLILRRILDQPLSKYLQDKIWKPLGMEFDAYLAVDESNFEFERAASGLFAVPEDIAKLGRLYLNNGIFNGVELIPKEWVEKSNQSQDFSSNTKYLSYFWRHSKKNDSISDYYTYAVGANGNKMMFLIPNEKIIILRFGKGMMKKNIKSAINNFSQSYIRDY